MLSGCLSVPFPNKLNTHHIPASLECVFIHGAFHSLSVLCYVCFIFVLLLSFSASLLPFPDVFVPNLSIILSETARLADKNAGSLQFTAGSRVVCICVCVVKYVYVQGQEQ